MREIQRDIVSALVISKDKKLLMGKKDSEAGGVYADCWHIPGGGIDEDEDKKVALEREIKEEVGIDISPYEIKLIDDQGQGTSNKTLKTGEEVVCHMKFNVYEVQIPELALNIEVILSDDLIEYVWADVDNLNEYNLTPPSIDLFKKIGYLEK